MNARELKVSLKNGSVNHLYLFYGAEEYLKSHYYTIIKNQLGIEFKDFNLLKIKEEKPDLDPLNAFIETPPVFSDKKLLFIKNSGIFKSANEIVKSFWIDKFQNIPPYLYLIFSEIEVDKRSVLFKGISKYGAGVDFEYLEEAALCSFIAMQARQLKKEISKETMLHFMERCDNGLDAITGELDKLLMYANSVVTIADVDKVVSPTLQNRVFVMMDAIMNKDTATALKIVSELKALKEPYQRIMYLTVMSFEKLLKAKLFSQSNMPMPTILASLELKPFIARKYIAMAKNFPADRLKVITASFADVDFALRSGIGTEWMEYEKLVICAANNTE